MEHSGRFVRLRWIAVHAVWLMFSLRFLFALLELNLPSDFVLGFGAFAVLGALLGAGQQWALRASRARIAQGATAAALGLGFAALAFAFAAKWTSDALGDDSPVPLLVALVPAVTLLVSAQALVERPDLFGWARRAATTFVGFAIAIFVFMWLMKDSTELPEGTVRFLCCAAVAGCVLGAISSVCLPKPRDSNRWPARRRESPLAREV